MSDARPVIPDAAFGASQAQPLDAFMAHIEAIDLDALNTGLDGAQAMQAADARRREHVTALAARLLQPEFRPLVDALLDVSLRRPMLVPGLGRERLSFLERREGANILMWTLLCWAAEGRGERPPYREGL